MTALGIATHILRAVDCRLQATVSASSLTLSLECTGLPVCSAFPMVTKASWFWVRIASASMVPVVLLCLHRLFRPRARGTRRSGTSVKQRSGRVQWPCTGSKAPGRTPSELQRSLGAWMQQSRYGGSALLRCRLFGVLHNIHACIVLELVS